MANNFGRGEDPISTTKYLDYNGLNIFLQKLKEYISDRITEINGSNLNLYSSGDTNPTITSQIEDLWGTIGNSDGPGGSLAENIANILGQYVKDIKNPETQNLPIKIKVEEGVDGNKDIYTISLIDNGLTETLEDLTDNRVSKLDTQNTTNNLVTISCDKNVGEVKLIVNDAGLLEALENIQSNIDENEEVCAEALTNLDSRLKIVEDGFGGIASNYVKSIKATGSDGITATPTTAANGEVEITISGLELKEEINDVKSNYLKISDTASDSNKLGGKDPSYYATKESVENITSNYVKSIKATGSNGIIAAPATANNGEVEITISGSGLEEEINDIKSNYLKTSDVPTKLPNPNKLTITDANGNAIEYDGSVAKDIHSISHSKTSDTASDSDKLDGHDSSYYATKESVDDVTSSYVKSIKATGSDGITATPTTAKNGEVEITISGSGLKEEINDIKSSIDENEEVCAEALTNLDSRLKDVEDGVSNINNYTINSKKISENPTLTGNDITLGVSVGDNNNYPTTQTISASIQKLRNTIADLGQVMELKGILEDLPDTTDKDAMDKYENGDVVIVGSEEYVCYEKEWYLLGNTTEIRENLESLIDLYDGHKHSLTAKGSIANTCNSESKSTTSSGITSSYKDGVLTITTSHNHDYNQTTSVTSIFTGEEINTGEPNSKFATE